MKVGREEVIGMLAAVESWVKRDHQAEWAGWVAQCEHIAARVSGLPGITAIVQREAGESRSNRSPRVTIRWDSSALGITGAEVSELLYEGEPRIALTGGGGRGTPDVPGDTGISMTSSMMARGDETIVADRVHAVLSARRPRKPAHAPGPPAANLSGSWRVEIEYAAGTGTETLHLQQQGNSLEGTRQGAFVARDITGTIDGDTVLLASHVTERQGFSLNYRFSGRVEGDVMSGTLDMGEYLGATWTARRHVYGRRS